MLNTKTSHDDMCLVSESNILISDVILMATLKVH